MTRANPLARLEPENGPHKVAVHRSERGQTGLLRTDLAATTQFFIERLGFRIDAIFPADNPPCIRHRVLESSAGAEVVEIGSPAEYITMADHTMTLTARLRPSYGYLNYLRVVQDFSRGPLQPALARDPRMPAPSLA